MSKYRHEVDVQHVERSLWAVICSCGYESEGYGSPQRAQAEADEHAVAGQDPWYEAYT